MSALLNAAEKGRLLNFGGCSLTVITGKFFSKTMNLQRGYSPQDTNMVHCD